MPTGDFHSSPDYRLSQYPGGDLYTHPHPGEYLVRTYLYNQTYRVMSTLWVPSEYYVSTM